MHVVSDRQQQLDLLTANETAVQCSAPQSVHRQQVQQGWICCRPFSLTLCVWAGLSDPEVVLPHIARHLVAAHASPALPTVVC